MRLPNNMKPPSNIHGIPLLGQQKQRTQTEEEKQAQTTHQIGVAIGQMAMQIYVQVAVGDLQDKHVNEPLNTTYLKQAAKDSVQAASAYFMALGVMKEDGTPMSANADHRVASPQTNTKDQPQGTQS